VKKYNNLRKCRIESQTGHLMKIHDIGMILHDFNNASQCIVPRYQSKLDRTIAISSLCINAISRYFFRRDDLRTIIPINLQKEFWWQSKILDLSWGVSLPN
jgi:hypothetical protein